MITLDRNNVMTIVVNKYRHSDAQYKLLHRLLLLMCIVCYVRLLGKLPNRYDKLMNWP